MEINIKLFLKKWESVLIGMLVFLNF
jgi:hypothetical protein